MNGSTDVQWFIKEPTKLLEEYCTQRGEALDYHMGRMSIALEILTVVRLLEGGEVPTLGHQEAITALHIILVETDLLDDAEAIYAGLAKWRQPTFIAENPDALQPHSGDASPPLGKPHLSLASIPASHPVVAAHQQDTDEALGSDQRTPPSSSKEEPPPEEGPTNQAS